MKKELLKFADWFERTIPDEKFRFDYIVTKRIKDTKCGSICCAIGWLPLYDSRVKWWDDDTGNLFLTTNTDGTSHVSYAYIVSTIFKMDRDDGMNLFNSYTQSDINRWGDYPVCGEDCTVKELANAIRHYVEIKS